MSVCLPSEPVSGNWHIFVQLTYLINSLTYSPVFETIEMGVDCSEYTPQKPEYHDDQNRLLCREVHSISAIFVHALLRQVVFGR